MKDSSVRQMFANISKHYDLLNRLLSFRRDLIWRRRAAKVIAAKEDERILDVAAGTGDMLTVMQKATLFAVDFCEEMLRIGYKKAPYAQFVVADAYKLPFSGAYFDKLTIAFGFRNISDKPAVLKEFARVLKPGGKMFILELSKPKSKLFAKFYWFYFEKVAPFMGRLISGQKGAYMYLPESVRRFPEEQEYLNMVAASGFEKCKLTGFDLGIAALLSAVKV